MLTIKVVHSDGSSITALAHNVRTSVISKGDRPAGLALLEGQGVPTRTPAFPDAVHFEREDGILCSVDMGTVYVMNETGKTIDTYYLHGPAAGTAEGSQPRS